MDDFDGSDMNIHAFERQRADAARRGSSGARRCRLLGGIVAGTVAALLGPGPDAPAAAKPQRERNGRAKRCGGKNWCIDRTQTCGPAGAEGRCFVEAFGGNVCGQALFQTPDCADCAFGNHRCVLAAGGGDRCNNGANGFDFLCVKPL
jgi:hypothetical protein